MKKVAIIGGTGDQGLGLALRFAQSNVPVIIGSRDETKANIAVEQVQESFPQADIKGMDNNAAVDSGDIILLSVPYKFMADTIKSIKSQLTPDKIVVSLCVPLANAVGGRPTQVVHPWEGSAAEQAAVMLPKDVALVGAFHNVCAARLLDIDNTVDNDVVVCSDDKDARQEIMSLADKIDGVRGLDGGKLCNCRIVEGITALIIGMNIRYKMPKGMGVRFTYLY
jgi:hypothetical protein